MKVFTKYTTYKIPLDGTIRKMSLTDMSKRRLAILDRMVEKTRLRERCKVCVKLKGS